jgi:hypothetical protein
MMTNHRLLAAGLAALLSGGATIAQAQVGQAADVSVDGRSLSFSNNARPFYSGRTVMVPAREMAGHLGVDFDRNDRGDVLRFRYRDDEAVYRKGRREFQLNGRNRSLPTGSVEYRSVLFVPTELFRDLTRRDIDTRRGSGYGNDPWTPGRSDVEVRFRGERLRFDRDQAPRTIRGTAYLPLRAVADQVGVRVDRDRSGNDIRLRYRDDEIQYDNGREDFSLNGRRVRMNASSQEIGGVLYVPQVMFQSLLGRDFQVIGSSWNGRPDWDDRPDYGRPGNGRPNRPDWDDLPGNASSRRVDVLYRGRTLSFGGDEQPFSRNGEVYVPLRAFADRLGVRVDRNDNGRRIRLTRDQDTVEYTQPYAYYELNGRRQTLRRGSVEVRDILFVPIDVFNVFTDGRVEVRRR